MGLGLVQQEETLQDYQGAQLPNTFWDSMSASFDAAKDFGFSQILTDFNDAAEADARPNQRTLSPEELNTKYNGLGITFTEPKKELVAQYIVQEHIKRAKLQERISSGPQGFFYGAARFGAGVAASLTDPLELGAMVVLNVAAPELLIGRAVAQRTLTQAAIRGAGVGALENLAFEAVKQPVMLARDAIQARDFEASNLLYSVGISAFAGAGFGAVAGAGAKFLRQARSTDNGVDVVAKNAIGQVLEGRRPNIRPLATAVGKEANGIVRPMVDYSGRTDYVYRPFPEEYTGKLYFGSRAKSDLLEDVSRTQYTFDGEYGDGFYVTDNALTANARAASSLNDGLGKIFELDAQGLKVLDLNKEVPKNIENEIRGVLNGFDAFKDIKPRNLADLYDILNDADAPKEVFNAINKKLDDLGYDGIAFKAGDAEAPRNNLVLFGKADSKIKQANVFDPDVDLVQGLSDEEITRFRQEYSAPENRLFHDQADIDRAAELSRRSEKFDRDADLESRRALVEREFNALLDSGALAKDADIVEQIKLFDADAERTAAIVDAAYAAIVRGDEDVVSAVKRVLTTSPDESVAKQAAEKIIPSEGVVDARARAFRGLLAETKLIDKAGEPSVVYHGTPNAFEDFSEGFFGSTTDPGAIGSGFYFSESPKEASAYANRIGGNVRPAFVNLKNPMILLRQASRKTIRDLAIALEKRFGGPVEAADELVALGKKSDAAIGEKITNLDLLRTMGQAPGVTREILKEIGFDGLVYGRSIGDRTVVVFDKENIVSMFDQVTPPVPPPPFPPPLPKTAATPAEQVRKIFPDVSDAQIGGIVDELSEIRREIYTNATPHPELAFNEAAQKYIADYNRNVEIARTKAAENIVKLKRVEFFSQHKLFKNKAEGVQAALVGTNKRVPGARSSVDDRFGAIRNDLFRIMRSDLSDSHMKILESGVLDKEIMVEIDALAKGGQIGRSGAQEAVDIAKAIHNVNRARLRVMNDAGAIVNDLDGYIVTQTHDRAKVSAVSKEEWIETIAEMIDISRTKRAAGVKDIGEYLGEVYEEIVEGRFGTILSDDADQVIKIIGTPQNMARRMELGRKIHFKSPEAFYEYNKQFGQRELAQQVVHQVESTARSAALMQVFGTNPKATIERLSRGLGKADQESIQRFLREVDGTASIPGVSMAAKIGRWARLSQTLSKLGGVVLSSFPDIGVRASILHMAGDNYLNALGRSFGNLFDTLASKKEREIAAEMTGVLADSHISAFIDRFGGDFVRPGALTKANDFFQRISGNKLWTEANESATAMALSRSMAMRADQAFAQLDEKFAKLMMDYDIGPVEWSILRRGIEVAPDGKTYASLTGIRQVPVADIVAEMQKAGMIADGLSLKATKAAAEQFRRSVSQKLSTYFDELSKTSVGKAGARERAIILRRGALEDSLEGQIIRYFAQFKSYSVSIISRLFGREIMAGGDDTLMNAIKNGSFPTLTLAAQMAGLTGLGYISFATKEMVRGRSMPDTSQPDTWTRAMIQGGVGGIYGDLLLGEFNSRYGRDALGAFAGPVIGQFSDVMDMWSQLKDGDPKAGQAMRFVVNNFPGGNLFYLRGALDYLFLYNIQEAINPGFKARMKTRLKDKGQEFLVAP